MIKPQIVGWVLPKNLTVKGFSRLWAVPTLPKIAVNDPKLSPVALNLIIDPANDILISPASYWEMAIKVSIGKLQISGSFQLWMEQQLTNNDFDILPITIAHAAKVAILPFHHRDPFDRLLVSQALTETIPIISADTMLDRYRVSRKWQ